MAEELKDHGLFKLPLKVRQRVLEKIGLSTEEYAEKLQQQLDRNKRQNEAVANGRTVHGWSTKKVNPGWCDDVIKGDAVLPPEEPQ